MIQSLTFIVISFILNPAILAYDCSRAGSGGILPMNCSELPAWTYLKHVVASPESGITFELTSPSFRLAQCDKEPLKNKFMISQINLPVKIVAHGFSTQLNINHMTFEIGPTNTIMFITGATDLLKPYLWRTWTLHFNKSDKGVLVERAVQTANHPEGYKMVHENKYDVLIERYKQFDGRGE